MEYHADLKLDGCVLLFFGFFSCCIIPPPLKDTQGSKVDLVIRTSSAALFLGVVFLFALAFLLIIFFFICFAGLVSPG
jgi:hypothetical protein